MSDNIRLGEILDHLKNAQEIAKSEYDIDNILQPGIVKELIIAGILGHKIIPDKHKPDAEDNHGNKFEYLSSINRPAGTSSSGCNFQIDRITPDNFDRVLRNKKFYFGVFEDHLTVEEVWEVETGIVLKEVKRQFTKSKNSISHVNLSLNWVKSNGKRVFKT